MKHSSGTYTYAPLTYNSTAIGYAPLTNAKFVNGITVGGDVSANSFNNISISYGHTDISSNIAIGYQALQSNVTGVSNIAIGNYSLHSNTQSGNVAIGINTLSDNTTGYNNTAIGSNALKLNTTGYNNTAIGSNGFLTNTTGNNNTIIGFNADILGTSFSNSTAIGYNSKATSSNQIMLGTSGEIVYCPSGIIITGNAHGGAGGNGVVIIYWSNNQ